MTELYGWPKSEDQSIEIFHHTFVFQGRGQITYYAGLPDHHMIVQIGFASELWQ